MPEQTDDVEFRLYLTSLDQSLALARIAVVQGSTCCGARELGQLVPTWYGHSGPQ